MLIKLAQEMTKIIIAFLIFVSAFAQNANRHYLGFKIEENTIKIETNDGVYFFNTIDNHTIETTFIPEGERYNANSYAKIASFSPFLEHVNNTKESLEFYTKKMTVRVEKSPFQILYFNKNEELIISEKKGYVKKDSLETIAFNLKPNEVLYGGGARVLGMNRRGHKLELYNKAHYGYETKSELMNFTLPIVMSSQKYMLHFDNAPIGYLDLDSEKNNTLTYETISGRKTYQLIIAETWQDLIYNYTNLTGKQPMPPRWALGNFSSRFGYHSEAEAENTIKKFKEEQIPVDAIILDLYWFGKEITGTMGNLEVFRDSFPNFENMVANFKSQGVKTITVTEPFILTTSKKWDDAKRSKVLVTNSDNSPATWDFYFGNTGLVDVFKPEGKQWFWSIYKDLHEKGVAGIWGDLGEPEVFPSSSNTYAGKADEVHNVYGHEWAKLIFEAYKKDFPDERPFILMRAGAAGSQRYGMIPWSGDVNRTWGGLSGQTEIALQMGMQGFGYMHSDLGGFAGANLDDELYVRWLQYGVFNPIFRPHAQEEVPSEPVYRSGWVKGLAKKAIELRYQLLPYNYHLVYENNQLGLPLMRPLFFEEEANKSLQTNASTYLWGNDFLITPIVTPKQKEIDIYFPKNSNWFDFYSDKKFEGGQTLSVIVEEEFIPTYVRGGAIIPTAKAMQHTGAYSGDNLDLHYYFDARVSESERSFYNDDGKTNNAFEKGAFEILHFEVETTSKFLEIELEQELGTAYLSEYKTLDIIFHNFPKPPKRIKSNRRKLDYSYNETTKLLRFSIKWDTSKKIETKIKY